MFILERKERNYQDEFFPETERTYFIKLGNEMKIRTYYVKENKDRWHQIEVFKCSVESARKVYSARLKNGFKRVL